MSLAVRLGLTPRNKCPQQPLAWLCHCTPFPAPLGFSGECSTVLEPRVLGQLSPQGRASLSSGLNGPVCQVRLIPVASLG